MTPLVVSVAVPLVLGAFTLIGVLLLHRRERERVRLDTTLRTEDRTQAAAQETIQTALSERGLERRIDALDTRYDAVQRRLDDETRAAAAFREAVAKEYMTRQEFIESQARIERKIDSIGVTLLDLARGHGNQQQ